MSRVDERSTYTKQAAMAVVIELIKDDRDDLASLFVDKIYSQDSEKIVVTDEHYYDGLSGIIYDIEPPEKVKERKDDVFRAYSWYAGRTVAKAINRRVNQNVRRVEFLEDLLPRFDVAYTDFEATTYLLKSITMEDDWFHYIDVKKYNKISRLSTDAIAFQIPYLKLTKNELFKSMDEMTTNPMQDKRTRLALRNAEAIEAMLLSCVAPDSRALENESTTMPVLARLGSSYEGYRVKSGKMCNYIKGFEMFRMGNIWFVLRNRVLYVLDRTGVEQLRNRTWSVFMMRWYAANYRKTGNEGRKIKDYFSIYHRCESWLWRKIDAAQSGKFHPRVIAKSMKVGHARIVNDGWKGAERTDFGGEERGRKLREEEVAIMNVPDPWSDFLKEECEDDNIAADIGYLFHIIPCPDANIEKLFCDTVERLKNERKSEQSKRDHFFAYFRASSLMDYVLHEGKKGTPTRKILKHIKCDDGYEIQKAEWFQLTVSGTATLPPEGDWMKAKIERAFPYNEKADTWHLEAKDATHVNADKDDIFDEYGDMRARRLDACEITYVLRHGSKLSKQHYPWKVRDSLARGIFIGDSVATLAAKAENTKFGEKTRETYSGADTLREMQSELDHSAQSLANITVGPSLRKSDYKINNEIIDIVATQYEPKTSKVLHVTTSQDVSSWSPSMNRKFAMRLYNEMISYTEAPKGMSVTPFYKMIEVLTNRRGVRAAEKTITGNFMGFPATFDTIIHSKICAYVIRMAKAAGILDEKDSSMIMCTIDDAVMNIGFRVDRSKPMDEAYKRVEDMMKFMTEVYASIGFMIDPVKTIIATGKFTYLNKIFAGGCEVLTPLKVFSKVNRELSKRFSSTCEQLQSVFTSLQGASYRGGDPVFFYFVGVWQAVRLAVMTTRWYHKTHVVIPVLHILTPTFLGGLGCPTLYSWLTKEGVDPLSEFFSLCNNYLRVNADFRQVNRDYELLCAMVERYLFMISNLKPKLRKRQDVMINPRAFVPEDLYTVRAAVSRRLHECALRIVDCVESKRMMKVIGDKNLEEWLEEVLDGCVMDAGILELIGSALPSQVMSAMLDKAEKNETVAVLMSGKEADSLKKSVKRLDRQHMAYLFKKYHEPMGEVTWDCTEVGHEPAARMRQKVFDLHNMTVLNATLSSMADLVQNIGDIPSEAGGRYCSISCAKILKQFGGSIETANMFDGRSIGKIKKGITTAGSVNFKSSFSKATDLVSRSLITIAFACAWLDNKGVDVGFLWMVLRNAWVDGIPVDWRELSSSFDPAISTKRLSPRMANANHPIACFPNTQACITVSIAPIARLMDKGNYHADLVTIITAMRVQGLIERAIRNKPFPTIYYGIDLRSFIPTDIRQMSLNQANTKMAAIADIVPITKDLHNSERFIRCLKTSFLEYRETIEGCDDDLAKDYLVSTVKEGEALIELDRLTMRKAGLKFSVAKALIDATYDQKIPDTKVGIFSKTTDSNVDVSAGVQGKTLKAAVDRFGAEGSDVDRVIKVGISAAVNGLGKQIVDQMKNLRTFVAPSFAKVALQEHFDDAKIIRAMNTVRNAFDKCYVKEKREITRLLFGNEFLTDLLRKRQGVPYLGVYTMIAKYHAIAGNATTFAAASTNKSRKEMLIKYMDVVREGLERAEKFSPKWWVFRLKGLVINAEIAVDPDNADPADICQAMCSSFCFVASEWCRVNQRPIDTKNFLSFAIPQYLEVGSMRSYSRMFVEVEAGLKPLQSAFKKLCERATLAYNIRKSVGSGVSDFDFSIMGQEDEALVRDIAVIKQVAKKEEFVAPKREADVDAGFDKLIASMKDIKMSKDDSALESKALISTASTRSEESMDTEELPAVVENAQQVVRTRRVRATALAIIHIEPRIERLPDNAEERLNWANENIEGCSKIIADHYVRIKDENEGDLEALTDMYEEEIKLRFGRGNADARHKNK